jgi:hypothetical protein
MSERYPQDVPDWRRVAEDQLSQPYRQDPADMLRGLQDQYQSEVMGIQHAAWDVALGALVRYGRPRCYDNLFNTYPEYSPLSTGLLSMGETEIEGVVTAPAVRVLVDDSRVSPHDLPLPVILAAQKSIGQEDAAAKQAAAHTALQGTAKLLGVTVETYVLSNEKDALKNDHAMRHRRREGSYGNMKWFRSKSGTPDEYELSQALQKPELAVWSVPIDAFGPARNHTFLHRPAMPTPRLPQNPSIPDYLEAWHDLLNEGRANAAHAAQVMDMLTSVTVPARNLEMLATTVR